MAYQIKKKNHDANRNPISNNKIHFATVLAEWLDP